MLLGLKCEGGWTKPLTKVIRIEESERLLVFSRSLECAGLGMAIPHWISGPKDDLPAGTGRCSIKFADQAADARPRKRVERARRKAKETSP